MPPNRSRVAATLAWVLFWTLMALVAVEDYRRNNGTVGLWKPVLWETSSALVATMLLLVQRRCTARHDGLIETPWRWFALQAAWLPLYWVAFVPLTFGIRHAVFALAGQRYDHAPWPQLFVYESLKISVFVGLFTVIGFGLLSYRALVTARLRTERSNTLLRQAQLQRLAQQMQPHFLFNALNTVSSLMHSDLTRAEATLVQLADVLRATLDLGERHEAPLEAELRLARGYAGVMAARFAVRVDVDWLIEQGLLATPLPAVCLQPLLENVFKHTVERRRAPVRIAVQAMRAQGTLVLRVEDDCGTLDPQAPQGIGLANLRERLAALHGDAASLTLSQLEPAGVRAQIEVPCAS